MIDPVEEVSRRAELFEKKLARGEQHAVLRLHATPGSPVIAPDARHEHCLAVIARELGFKSYAHARPKDHEVRARLYLKRLRSLPDE